MQAKRAPQAADNALLYRIWTMTRSHKNWRSVKDFLRSMQHSAGTKGCSKGLWRASKCKS
eukprot:4654608-Amphidinium_carterae.1